MYAAPSQYQPHTSKEQETHTHRAEIVEDDIVVYLSADEYDELVTERAASGIHPVTWLMIIAVSLVIWAGIFYVVSLVVNFAF